MMKSGQITTTQSTEIAALIVCDASFLKDTFGAAVANLAQKMAALVVQVFHSYLSLVEYLLNTN